MQLLLLVPALVSTASAAAVATRVQDDGLCSQSDSNADMLVEELWQPLALKSPNCRLLDFLEGVNWDQSCVLCR